MGLTHIVPNPKFYVPNPWITSKTRTRARTKITSFPRANCPISEISPLSQSSPSNPAKAQLNFPHKIITCSNMDSNIPTMAEIMEASKAQNLELQLQTLGPFFRITAKSLDSQREVGRAEGLIRVWLGGKKILHLDSIRLKRETMGMKRSIFGTGLFIGAVAIRYGYDCGCRTAELLAINDTDLYHSKLVRFYTRMGFKAVYEVSGSWIGDVAHMLVWGGVGTRMDADISYLLHRWCARFKSKSP
ncbi:uncharacterized protein LOC127813635 [Diospyros lotus]|uniref:uncharacterized protein LOC127813635 n=1 Tax=Diospyros lotus TaxID=55363 RepID=UPI00225A5369|nr:uncharacterized protein LOC127813635 [Diospyros lotus]